MLREFCDRNLQRARVEVGDRVAALAEPQIRPRRLRNAGIANLPSLMRRGLGTLTYYPSRTGASRRLDARASCAFATSCVVRHRYAANAPATTPGWCVGEILRFIFSAHGYRLRACSPHVMASRKKRSKMHQTKTNARATFKLFGQAPMQATLLSRNRAGFWIQGGKLAEFLGGCDYSGVEVDVCFLSANKVEWYKTAPANAHGAETGK